MRPDDPLCMALRGPLIKASIKHKVGKISKLMVKTLLEDATEIEKAKKFIEKLKEYISIEDIHFRIVQNHKKIMLTAKDIDFISVIETNKCEQ